MKIQLVNFLCYQDTTFDFGTDGVALLSGPSGAGKTSVLRGIFFVLFGEGKKLQAYGKTSCRVEMEFDGLKIVRTKRPNHLVVNDVYEDSAGQAIIDKKFGSTFKTSGYIQQNNLTSFILMSSVDKLKFLEKFAFKDVDMGKIKGRCKAHIAKRNTEHTNILGKIELATKVLDEMNVPNEVKFPLKIKTRSKSKSGKVTTKQYTKTIKNENIRFKNCKTLIKRSRKKKKVTETAINDLKVLEATLQSRNESYKDYSEKLDDLMVEVGKLDYIGDNKLQDYKNSLKAYVNARELHILEDQLKEQQNKLHDMKNEELNILKVDLAQIVADLWEEYTEEELTENITEVKQLIKDATAVGKLRKSIKACKEKSNGLDDACTELQTCTNDLTRKQTLYDDIKAQNDLYSCPCCMANLNLIDEKLVLSLHTTSLVTKDTNSDVLLSEILELKVKIHKLETTISVGEFVRDKEVKYENELSSIIDSYEEGALDDPEELEQNLEYYNEYLATQNELMEKKTKYESKIENEKFSVPYRHFKRGVKKLKARVAELQENSDTDETTMNEEQLRDVIRNQTRIFDKLENYNNEIRKLSERKTKCKLIIDNATKKYNEKYDGNSSLKSLIDKLSDYDKTINDLLEQHDVHEQNLQKVADWQAYQEELKRLETWGDQLAELEVEKGESTSKLVSAKNLKDKIMEAESTAVINILDSINTHARVYLDSFFVENPISVQLKPFKETKKSTVPKITIEIEYKGMEADLNMLSGGELARVILAYTLALAEMFNTPLLLLDECTASLDEELTSTVFESIRENFNGKLTLSIAHQVVSGAFDTHVKI